MNFIIKYILKFLDSFTEKQITNYLKIIFSSKIPLIIDVGSHKGEYNMLKNVTNIIDITNSLDESKNLSYDDGIHYSPSGNETIASKIYNIIKDKLNDQ